MRARGEVVELMRFYRDEFQASLRMLAGAGAPPRSQQSRARVEASILSLRDHIQLIPTLDHALEKVLDEMLAALPTYDMVRAANMGDQHSKALIDLYRESAVACNLRMSGLLTSIVMARQSRQLQSHIVRAEENAGKARDRQGVGRGLPPPVAVAPPPVAVAGPSAELPAEAPPPADDVDSQLDDALDEPLGPTPVYEEDEFPGYFSPSHLEKDKDSKYEHAQFTALPAAPGEAATPLTLGIAPGGPSQSSQYPSQMLLAPWPAPPARGKKEHPARGKKDRLAVKRAVSAVAQGSEPPRLRRRVTPTELRNVSTTVERWSAAKFVWFPDLQWDEDRPKGGWHLQVETEATPSTVRVCSGEYVRQGRVTRPSWTAASAMHDVPACCCCVNAVQAELGEHSSASWYVPVQFRAPCSQRTSRKGCPACSRDLKLEAFMPAGPSATQ